MTWTSTYGEKRLNVPIVLYSNEIEKLRTELETRARERNSRSGIEKHGDNSEIEKEKHNIGT